MGEPSVLHAMNDSLLNLASCPHLPQTNKKGLKLVCSHFIPLDVKGRDGRLPCVIYCHCNSGSRRDAEEAVRGGRWRSIVNVIVTAEDIY